MRSPRASVLAVITGVLVAGGAALGLALGIASAASGSPARGADRIPHSSTAGTGGMQTYTVTAAGRLRTYLLYVPPGDTSKHRLPLVLVYHGAYDTAENIAGETGLLSYAEQHHNMIVAFLQGYEDSWNDDAGNPPAEADHVNDVAFTEAVLNRVESSHYVDMHRVAATGISNGAILAELLGCRAAAYLTLTVPVEGQMSPAISSSCRPSKPIFVYEIHATSDPTIPYDGGTFGGYGGPVTVLSAHASAARWAQVDKCKARPSTRRSTTNIFTTYTHCKSGVTVTLQSIQGGSHDWPPGFAMLMSRLVTSSSRTPKAVKP